MLSMLDGPDGSDGAPTGPGGPTRSLVDLADRTLHEQADTGAPETQTAVEAAVERLADRLVDLAGLGMTRAPVGSPPSPAEDGDPPGDLPPVGQRSRAGDPASCSAMAAGLRRAALRLAVVDVPAGSRPVLRAVEEDLQRLALGLQEHAIASAEIRRRCRRLDEVLAAGGLEVDGARVRRQGAGAVDPQLIDEAQARLDRVLSLAGRSQAELLRVARTVRRTTVS